MDVSDTPNTDSVRSLSNTTLLNGGRRMLTYDVLGLARLLDARIGSETALFHEGEHIESTRKIPPHDFTSAERRNL